MEVQTDLLRVHGGGRAVGTDDEDVDSALQRAKRA